MSIKKTLALLAGTAAVGTTIAAVLMKKKS